MLYYKLDLTDSTAVFDSYLISFLLKLHDLGQIPSVHMLLKVVHWYFGTLLLKELTGTGIRTL